MDARQKMSRDAELSSELVSDILNKYIYIYIYIYFGGEGDRNSVP